MSNMFNSKYDYNNLDPTTIEVSTPSLLKDVFSKSNMQSKPSRYLWNYCSWDHQQWDLKFLKV